MGRLMLVVAIGLGTACLGGCSDDDPTLPPDAPAGHTVSQSGVAHRTGLHDPLENCVACHGATLMGGTDGEPSCYSCHGKKW